jgi:hypothetical protein
MRKSTLRVYHTYQQELTPQSQLDLGAKQERCARKELAKMAREQLSWSTALVDERHWRPCPDGCGLIFMSRHREGKHIDLSELIADWKNEPPKDEPQDADTFMQAPIEVPLRPAVSKAQIMWARSMIDQFPRKTQEQIERENSVSWRQLQHWAHSSTDGLPERAAKKAPPPKAPTKKATTPKASPKAKAKGA